MLSLFMSIYVYMYIFIYINISINYIQKNILCIYSIVLLESSNSDLLQMRSTRFGWNQSHCSNSNSNSQLNILVDFYSSELNVINADVQWIKYLRIFDIKLCFSGTPASTSPVPFIWIRLSKCTTASPLWPKENPSSSHMSRWNNQAEIQPSKCLTKRLATKSDDVAFGGHHEIWAAIRQPPPYADI